MNLKEKLAVEFVFGLTKWNEPVKNVRHESLQQVVNMQRSYIAGFEKALDILEQQITYSSVGQQHNGSFTTVSDVLEVLKELRSGKLPYSHQEE